MSRSYTSSPQAPPWLVAGLLYFTFRNKSKLDLINKEKREETENAVSIMSMNADQFC
jgi:hypothetical protein